MMHEQSEGLISVLNKFFGGAGMTIMAALLGRLMYHAVEVRAARRPIFSADLIWELPIAFGMAVVGEAMSEWLALSDTIQTGLIAGLAYLGPRSFGVMLDRVSGAKK